MKKIFLLTLCVSACANLPHDSFYYPGGTKTSGEQDADFNECLMQAQVIGNGSGGLMGYAVYQSARDRCMRGKGYIHQCGQVRCKE